MQYFGHIGRAALMLAAFAPLLADAKEPYSAVAAAQTSDPGRQHRHRSSAGAPLVRELPGRVAPTRVSDGSPARVRHRRRAPFQSSSEVKAGDTL